MIAAAPRATYRRPAPAHQTPQLKRASPGRLAPTPAPLTDFLHQQVFKAILNKCYQLTSKSDVYSFGVVLIELISSKLAVDMNRHKDEINLSNLALKKIQEGALTELVDPYLAFDSDNEVKRMIVSVAELAFQCLQRDKELRPSMDEVLKVLMRIESGKDVPEHIVEEDERPHSPVSPDGDEIEIELFHKMMPQPSPKAVVDKWNSQSTSSNTSGH